MISSTITTRSVIGVEAPYKPFPTVVERNRHRLRNIRTVIEIGAGTGRFVKWFLRNTNVELYIAIEPSQKGINALKKIKDPRLQVIRSYWEFIRDKIITKTFDVVILWDVLMFVDLTSVHDKEDYLQSILKETKHFVDMANKYILLSFHPVKRGLLKTVSEFKPILYEFLKHGCQVMDKTYLNYILAVPPQ